jgi:phenylacetate-CoA ligase
MKDVIFAAFGARAYEEYSATENCVLATECEHGNLHVSPDFGIMEIVDEQGRPAPAGQPGRIVCTGLLNDVQPLIRYQIGDLACWAEAQCSCGRQGLPVIQSLEGRIEDVVVGPDGREMVRFHSVFFNLPNIVEAQVIQERVDVLRVKVVGTSEFSAADAGEISSRIRGKLGDVSVSIQRVDAIPRNSRGKFRAVISQLSAEERKSIKEMART